MTPGAAALAAWITEQRWFAGKTRRIAAVTIDDRVPFPTADLIMAAVALDDGSRHRYAVPLGRDSVPRDGLDDPAFCRALLEVVKRGARVAGEAGEVVGVPVQMGGLEGPPEPPIPRSAPAKPGRSSDHMGGLDGPPMPPARSAPAKPGRSSIPQGLDDALAARRLPGEQSNTSVVFGEALILKHFRRLEDGVHPEAEMTRFLTERARFAHTPRLAGHLEYRVAGQASTLGVVHELVSGARDGWPWLLERLRERSPDTLQPLRRLGEQTAELHRALASDATDPAFAPEPITPADLAAWAEAVRERVAEARRAAGEPGLGADARAIAGGLAALLGRVKIRHHGDFHLGQTLYRSAAADFMIIDFEGEPLRPLAERREKHAAARDVASMLRSIGYAAASAGGDPAWGARWEAAARGEFLAGYRLAASDAPFVPVTAEAFAGAVEVFELEKAAYEIVYEANNRPGWMAIPLRGFVRAAASLARRSEAGAA
jgi:predicted trehalose synthase